MATSDIRTPFKTTRDAAYGVGRAGERSLERRLTHLPYNRFDKLLDSTWWLSTSSDLPAYRHGKIVFTHDYFGDDLFIGLYVEKGIGKELADWAFPGRRYGMDSTWLWNAFAAALGGSEISSILDELHTKSERGVTVAIDGGTPGEAFDFVRFEYRGGLLSCEQNGSGALSSLNDADCLGSLASAISALPNLDSLWLDFHAGLVFSDAGATKWAESAIWENVCAPFKAWLK